MAAQPNMAVLSAALQTVSTEVGLVPNMPAIAQANQMQQVLQTLQQHSTQFQQVLQQLQQIRQDAAVSERNNLARMHNRHLGDEEALEDLVNNLGNTPINFPQNFGVVYNMTAPAMAALLQAYNLPNQGQAGVLRSRLLRHLGRRP